ncbi:MAG: hypothetical protein KDB53_15340 [Planctomycetes bacterium]|nr:hypothetical protein [Planctomycetota bacterium]
MSERVVVAAVIVLVALAAGFMIGGEDETIGMAGTGPTTLPAAPSPRRAAEEVLPVPPTLDPVELSPATPPPLAPKSMPTPLPPGEGPLLQVKDWTSKAPVGDAFLVYFDANELEPDEITLDYLRGLDCERLLDERGFELPVDAQGYLRLGPTPGDYLVRARHDGRKSSVVRFSGRPEPAKKDHARSIWLRPPTRRVSVRCLLGNQSARGVPVARQVDAKAPFLDLRSTDDEGVAHFEVSGDPDSIHRIVFAGVCGGPRPAVDVRATDLSPARLALPLAGTLVLRLVDRSGQRCRRPFGVTLRAMARDPAEASAPQTLRVDDGEVRFEWVGIGQRFEVGARPLDGSHQPRSAILPAIEGPGMQVEHQLVFENPSPMLQAQVCGRDGRPLVRTEVIVAVRELGDPQAMQFDDWVDHEPLLTRANGELRVALRAWDGKVPVECRIALSQVDAAGNRVIGDRVLVPRLTFRNDQVWLGTLELSEPPILAAGFVMNAAGEPVPARVSAYRFDPGDDIGRQRMNDLLPCGTRVCDARGYFEFKLDAPCKNIIVVAESSAGKRSKQLCRPGTMGLRLMIE